MKTALYCFPLAQQSSGKASVNNEAGSKDVHGQGEKVTGRLHVVTVRSELLHRYLKSMPGEVICEQRCSSAKYLLRELDEHGLEAIRVLQREHDVVALEVWPASSADHSSA